MPETKPVWTPSARRCRRTQMHAFLTRVVEEDGIEPTWPALHAWSVDSRNAFWTRMIDFAGIKPLHAADAVVSGQGMLDTKWFPGMKLNFAAHLLRFADDHTAIESQNELGRTRSITYRELNIEVSRCARALRQAGVVKGDRVAAFIPNIPEAVIAMLATASIGAIWSSCSPDFGIDGVFDRFGQIKPTVLIAADGYTYNGKPIDSLDRVRGIVAKIDSINRVVIVAYVNDAPDVSSIDGAVVWSDFLDGGDHDAPNGASSDPKDDALRPEFEAVSFDHPLYIMYSSGTTGVPKCIVHGHGGTLLQQMKELILHCDLRRDDRIFYFTTCGWMMWNWLVSALGVGATIVLYEGSPFHPKPRTLWAMAERLGVSVFGTSPKFISACEKVGLDPRTEHDLSKLRAVLSTGSPLTDENFRWVYEHIKDDVQLSSICGGTDIISCFMLGNPILPVYPGEIQCLGLGMDVRAVDADGQPLIGQKGELVCCAPFPSQPIGFWNDPDGEKYRKAYFDHFDGVWRHGDFVEITERGGVIVYGRSDATLNPGGVRIGTAEIYRIVEAMEEVVDSVVVGKRTEDADVEVCLFVVLREGLSITSELIDTIKQRIAQGASKRHVPRIIKQVSAVPYTISGKKVELAVQLMIHGDNVPNRDALANPDVLDEYEGIV